MTGEQRQLLRVIFDRRARRLLEADRQAFAPKECVGCGGPLDGYTTNCKPCHDRRRRRRWRQQGPELENRTHGLRATYNAGCRCEACKQSRRVHDKQLRQRRSLVC